MKLLAFIGILTAGAGLVACSSFYRSSGEYSRITVKDGNDIEMDSLVAPYRRELSAEMGKVLGRTLTDLTVARPNSTMGQWICDLTRDYGKKQLVPAGDDSPVMCLLNFGGLRASAGAGEITVGDVFRIMPFDNLAVAVKLPIDSLQAVRRYIAKTGGEPVSGLSVTPTSISLTDGNAATGYFWIITSDFAANGGDRMYFFSNPAQRIDSPKLLRDLMTEDLQNRKVLDIRLEERVRL
jgi:2',3'-cyclic-nucleotide 2'-phosphodiesterase (5'-nucleotidase family)